MRSGFGCETALSGVRLGLVFVKITEHDVGIERNPVFFFFFFSPRRFERAIRKIPNMVRCLAVKSALYGTRHPRKEKEVALQNVIGEPACLCGEITMCHSIGDGTKH